MGGVSCRAIRATRAIRAIRAIRPGTAEAHKAAESVHFVKEFIRCRVDQPKLGDVKEKPRFGKTMELLENMVGYTHTGTLV